MPKISIISINYNNADGLCKTIQSVINQTYQDIEYIVIDGSSEDHSREIIEEYKQGIHYWVSEPDTGIYNAMNKGICAATSEYLLFINSGDVLVDKNVIHDVILEGLTADLVYGDLIFVNGIQRREWLPASELTFKVFFKESIPHPSTFIRRSLFDRVGFYNEKYKIVSDWEFFMLAICRFNCSYKHINRFITLFAEDGISTSPGSYYSMMKERECVMKHHFPVFIKDYEAYDQLERQMKKIAYFIKARTLVKKMLKFMKLGPKCF